MMIKELIEYALTPSSELAKNFGYLKEIIGIKSRYLRNQKPWQSHLQNCHDVIVNFCEQNPQAESMAILGSGFLQEVPIKFILNHFKKIYLYDLVFPREVRALAKQHTKIELVECDLSGALEFLQNGKLRMRSPYFQIPADLVLSVNLLSQLPLKPYQWILDKKLAEVSECEKFCREIIKNHLRLLKQSSQPSLLISDYEKVFYDRNQNLIESQSSLFSVPISGQKLRTWDWHIAPIGELNPRYSMVLKVLAIDSSLK
jgi:hypothetical protein